MERGFGAIIKLELPEEIDETQGQKLTGYLPDRKDLTYEQPRVVDYSNSPNAKLLARIDRNMLTEEYLTTKHQTYVDRKIKELGPDRRGRLDRLWKEKQAADPDMPNRGASFVRILDYLVREQKKENRK